MDLFGKHMVIIENKPTLSPFYYGFEIPYTRGPPTPLCPGAGNRVKQPEPGEEPERSSLPHRQDVVGRWLWLRVSV